MSDPAIKIQSNVPIPTSYTGKRCSYPFAQMKIGDSFFVKASDYQVFPKVRYAVAYWAKRHKGFWYTTRKEGDGLRVWRIAEAEQ